MKNFKNKIDAGFWKNIRTDLALEARELVAQKYESNDIDGIKMRVFESGEGRVNVAWVEVLNETGAANINQPVGDYITIESDCIKTKNSEEHNKLIEIFAEYFQKISKLKDDAKVLIVGLGNWRVTPDALGPKVAEKVLVTRHVLTEISEEIKAGVREVSAIAPGVMGITGIETAELVRGVVDKIKPDLVVAIDALASRSAKRVNAAIQMNNTGINPGSGLNNRRLSLNKEFLGVDVIGIGVPTVVDAATLVNDAMDMILKEMLAASEKGSAFYDTLIGLSGEEKYEMIKSLLNEENMFVTPKEIDETIEILSNLIANGLNIALHPSMDKEDINRYMH
jgi:spore protease